MVKDKDINKHYFMYKYFASARLSFVANSRSIMLCELVFPSPTLHTTFSTHYEHYLLQNSSHLE